MIEVEMNLWAILILALVLAAAVWWLIRRADAKLEKDWPVKGEFGP